MKKYPVRVCQPTLYEVEAENWEQAEKKALKMFRKDHNTWLGEIHPEWRVSETKPESEEAYS